jgi:hypothetical protein
MADELDQQTTAAAAPEREVLVGTEPASPSSAGNASASRPAPTVEVAGPPGQHEERRIDLVRRRDELNARVAELQWDLGGLVYEMAIRDRIRVDVIVRRAALLQDADAELAEIERILRTEQTGTAGTCSVCGAPHSSGAGYCWQCGHQILRHVDTSSIIET